MRAGLRDGRRLCPLGGLSLLLRGFVDNGRAGTGYFQPLSRGASHFPDDKADALRSGLHIDVGAPGWRRVWVARDADGRIAGHVDLRAHAERHTAHRCLLGMGVDRAHRKAGLGGRLLAHAQRWAGESAALAWIDEADSLAGEVSWIAPIARALLKAREGDEVALVTPGGVERIEVLQVRYPQPD